MDVPRSQGYLNSDLPRHLYFGAEDRRLGGRAGLEEKYLTMEKARRHQLAEHVINTANQLATSVRTLRAFDRTGSADMALDHIEQTFEDLRKHTTNLVNEVNASVDRHADEVERLAFQDIADGRATAPPRPKPGPVPIYPTSLPSTPILKAKVEAALNNAERNRAGR